MCLYLYETRKERRKEQIEEQNVKRKNKDREINQIKEKDATTILIMTLLIMFTLLIITVLKTLNKGDFTNNAYFTYNDFN